MTPAQAQWKAELDRASKAELEALLAQDLTAARIAYHQQVRFHPKRRWKADFVIDNLDLLIEIEGGTYIHRTGRTFVGKDGKRHEMQSRHLTPNGFHDDCEKYNQAALLGYRVFRFDAKMVRSGDAFLTIKHAYDLWHEQLAERITDNIEAEVQADLDWLHRYETRDEEEEDAEALWTTEDQWQEQIRNR